MGYLWLAVGFLIVMASLFWSIILSNGPDVYARGYTWTLLLGFILMLMGTEAITKGTPETMIKTGTYNIIAMAGAPKNDDKGDYVYFILEEGKKKVGKFYRLPREMIEASAGKPTRIEIVEEKGIFKKAVLRDSKPSQ